MFLQDLKVQIAVKVSWVVYAGKMLENVIKVMKWCLILETALIQQNKYVVYQVCLFSVTHKRIKKFINALEKMLDCKNISILL